MSTPPFSDQRLSTAAAVNADAASAAEQQAGQTEPQIPGSVSAGSVSAGSVSAGSVSTRSGPPVRVYLAETIEERVSLVDEPSLPLRTVRGLGRCLEWCLGIPCLLVILAVLASIPVAQFISLGYLLEVSARISLSGRLRDGFLEIGQAARIGSLFAGTWLVMLPLRLVADIWYTSQLIDPASGITTGWRIGTALLTGLTVVHILLAWYCGGRLRHFLWPVLSPLLFAMWFARRAVSSRWCRPLMEAVVGRLSPRLLQDLTGVPRLDQWFPPAVLAAALRRGRIYSECRDAVWDFVVNLHIPHYFWLGLRGFVGAVLWLLVPVSMMISSIKVAQNGNEGLGGLLGLCGSLCLATVVLYLPFLQANFAAENRLRAMFQWGLVRRQFRRAPFAFWFALLITLLFAVPLYLLKIAVIPREVVWLPSLVFVSFILPARMITGWAVGRARHCEQPRFFLFRWLARAAAIPLALAYAMIVYFTQYTSWHGSWSLFEQHAFLTPVPFLGL